MFVSRFPNGRPRVAGSYDAAGLRTGVWRFWFEDGRPSRELEFSTACASAPRASGTRTASWRPTGATRQVGATDAGASGTSGASSRADVFYRDGVRDSTARWRWYVPH